jgi:hypothetical protein
MVVVCLQWQIRLSSCSHLNRTAPLRHENVISDLGHSCGVIRDLIASHHVGREKFANSLDERVLRLFTKCEEKYKEFAEEEGASDLANKGAVPCTTTRYYAPRDLVIQLRTAAII